MGGNVGSKLRERHSKPHLLCKMHKKSLKRVSGRKSIGICKPSLGPVLTDPDTGWGPYLYKIAGQTGAWRGEFPAIDDAVIRAMYDVNKELIEDLCRGMGICRPSSTPLRSSRRKLKIRIKTKGR